MCGSEPKCTLHFQWRTWKFEEPNHAKDARWTLGYASHSNVATQRFFDWRARRESRPREQTDTGGWVVRVAHQKDPVPNAPSDHKKPEPVTKQRVWGLVSWWSKLKSVVHRS